MFCVDAKVIISHFVQLSSHILKVHRTFSRSSSPFGFDSSILELAEGITQRLRLCRSAPPLSVGLNLSSHESPQDFLSLLEPFRVRFLYSGAGGGNYTKASPLPFCASPFGRLEPLVARKSTGLSFAPRALSGSIPLFWSWRRESNPQPADYKSAALPLSHASGFSVSEIWRSGTGSNRRPPA